ncbi:MAG: fasciclin domain-containing protein [Sandaracinus sp.]|nr:fasciclin domain-containing protein [Sandaracinus sp.]
MKSTRFFLLLGALAFGLVGCGDDDGPTPTPDGGMPTTDSSVASNTIVDIAVGNPDFSTLVGALQAAGLDDDLAGEGPFTVFAPTNAAFEALAAVPEGEALSQVLQYHVVSGAVRSTDLAEGINLPESLNDLTLFVSRAGGSVTLNGGVNVTTADIVADNGVIHVIDAVLIPPTIADAAGHAGLSSLLGAATEAGAVGGSTIPAILAGEGPFTVFAPTNDAFTALYAAAEVDGPADLPDEALQTVLFYHVIAGAAVESDAVPGAASSAVGVDFLEGDDAPGLTLLFDTSSGVSINGGSDSLGADVVIADVKCTNGVVHVIDSVLLPMDIVDIAVAAGFTTLVGAVGDAADIPGTPPTPVADALTGDGPLTVFAPTNAAFEAIASTVSGLSAEQLRDVLLYHVVGGAVLSTDLETGNVEMLSGQNAAVDLAATPPTIAGQDIVLTDIVGINGVVHVVGGVMLPPS